LLTVAPPRKKLHLHQVLLTVQQNDYNQEDKQKPIPMTVLA